MARTMAGGATAGDGAAADFLKRWVTVWALLLVVVTGVVVVFLIVITNSLAAINGDLAVADEAVTGIGGETKTLPDQVETVNASLGGIDPNLKPIPGQADQIIASLRSIDAKLTSVDSSLKSTAPTLRNAAGTVGTIRGVLVDADDPPDRLGVQNIHERVAFVNGAPPGPGPVPNRGTGSFGVNPGNLSAAKGDTGNILGQLVEANKHLRSICGSPAVSGDKAGCR